MALRNISLAMTTRGGADLIGRRSEVLVLDAARRGEAVDRASLAAQTELTPQAVSNVLTRLTDAGLVALEPLQDLRSLQISGNNKITNAGLAHIARLTRLQTLGQA